MNAPDAPLLIFSLDETAFALPASAVTEVLPLANLARPAGAPAVLAGFLNLGGAPLPVIDLAVVLGETPTRDRPDIYRHILRLSGPTDAGLLVDRVSDAAAIADVATADGEEPGGDAVVARLTVAGRIVSLLDPEQLLLKEEALRLAELAEVARARIADLAAAGEA